MLTFEVGYSCVFVMSIFKHGIPQCNQTWQSERYVGGRCIFYLHKGSLATSLLQQDHHCSCAHNDSSYAKPELVKIYNFKQGRRHGFLSGGGTNRQQVYVRCDVSYTHSNRMLSDSEKPPGCGRVANICYLRWPLANLPPKYPKNPKKHRIWATSFSNLEPTSPPKFFTGGRVPPLSTPMLINVLKTPTRFGLHAPCAMTDRPLSERCCHLYRQFRVLPPTQTYTGRSESCHLLRVKRPSSYRRREWRHLCNSHPITMCRSHRQCLLRALVNLLTRSEG